MIHELFLAGVAFFHPQIQGDSIGTETVNGKIYVLHRVEEKETLFAISRKYSASVESIMQSNPGLSSSLEIGQVIKVPYTPKATSKVVSNAKTHKVAAKETMYGISRMYNVSVDEIREWNNLKDNNISIGQELIVSKPKAGQATAQAQPSNQSSPVTSTPVTTQNDNASKTGVHTVAPRETLFSIAKQYNITVDQLKRWNTLEMNELRIGQVIFVAPPEQPREVVTTPRTEPKKDVVVAEERITVEEPKKDVVTESTPSRTESSEAVASRTQTIKISESLKNSDEVVETGVAELIEGTEGNRKYLALHRTAPVGTILKVRNEMNNREVFVRVMGKLPDTAVNNKLIIKLSRSAYDRLGAIDPKFRVEVTYYK